MVTSDDPFNLNPSQNNYSVSHIPQNGFLKWLYILIIVSLTLTSHIWTRGKHFDVLLARIEIKSKMF